MLASLSHGPQDAVGLLHSPRRSPTSRSSPPPRKRATPGQRHPPAAGAPLWAASRCFQQEPGETGRPRQRRACLRVCGSERRRGAERGGRTAGGGAAPRRQPRAGPGVAAGAEGLREPGRRGGGWERGCGSATCGQRGAGAARSVRGGGCARCSAPRPACCRGRKPKLGAVGSGGATARGRELPQPQSCVSSCEAR